MQIVTLELEIPKGDGSCACPPGDTSPDPQTSRFVRLLLLESGMQSCTAFPLSGQHDLLLADFAGEPTPGDKAGEFTLGDDTGDALAEEDLDLGSLIGSFITNLGQKT